MDTSSPAPEPAIEWPQHVGPYHLSLAQWLRWASGQLKDLSAKVQMLEINYPEAVPISERFPSRRPVPNGRFERLEEQVFGYVFPRGSNEPWAPKPLPHANGHTEPRLVALEKTFDTAFTRIRDLEFKMQALEMKVEEPVAERTRHRKQSRRPSPP